jgi:hypothetical protein
MQINQTNNYSTNFKALKVATTQNTVGKVVTNIDLYQLEKSDKKFLSSLKKKIDIKKLFPKLDTLALDRWQHLFEYCINTFVDSFDDVNTTYLAVKGNKPCGILTYTDKGSEYYLDGICSIPIEVNKKENFVGQTLFLQFFKDFQHNNIKKATLSAVNDGPFNVVDKYKKLGFVKDMTTYPYSKMACNKYKVKDQIGNLSEVIKYSEVNPEKVNLADILD